jgi:hypothetical protein
MIGQAWNDISSRLMNGCWKNLYPESVQHGLEEFYINATHKEM